jgi:lysophospholipase L1-like esterase
MIRHQKKSIIYGIYIFLVVLISSELLLRIFGVNITYTESIGQPYRSPYNQFYKSHYLTHEPQSQFILDHRDFKYEHATNELGFREVSMDSFFTQCAHSYKILALGDSYTEGVGAPEDSSWVKLLEKKMKSQNQDVCCFNAGISGSDPFFQYMLLRDKLNHLNFDLIVVAVNSTDIHDYIFRGGMERFRENGTTVGRRGPRYEFLYQYSYLFRLIDRIILRNKRQMFITEQKYQSYAQQFVKDMDGVLDRFIELTQGNPPILLVVFPSPHEAANRKKADNILTKKNLQVIVNNAKYRAIATLNLFPYFEQVITKDNLMDYTYKNDGHYNPKGYEKFASFVLPVVDSLLTLEHTNTRANTQPE